MPDRNQKKQGRGQTLCNKPHIKDKKDPQPGLMKNQPKKVPKGSGGKGKVGVAQPKRKSGDKRNQEGRKGAAAAGTSRPTTRGMTRGKKSGPPPPTQKKATPSSSTGSGHQEEDKEDSNNQDWTNCCWVCPTTIVSDPPCSFKILNKKPKDDDKEKKQERTDKAKEKKEKAKDQAKLPVGLAVSIERLNLRRRDAIGFDDE